MGECPAALILRYKCCSGDVPARYRVEGLAVNDFGLHFGTLGCSLKLVTTDGLRGVRNGLPPLSYPWSGEFAPTTLQEVITK